MAQAFAEFLKNLSASLQTASKGLGGFLLNLIFTRLIDELAKWFKRFFQQKEADKKLKEEMDKDNKNAEVYKEVINKENVTRDEVKNATSDLLNRL